MTFIKNNYNKENNVNCEFNSQLNSKKSMYETTVKTEGVRKSAFCAIEENCCNYERPSVVPFSNEEVLEFGDSSDEDNFSDTESILEAFCEKEGSFNAVVPFNNEMDISQEDVSLLQFGNSSDEDIVSSKKNIIDVLSEEYDEEMKDVNDFGCIIDDLEDQLEMFSIVGQLDEASHAKEVILSTISKYLDENLDYDKESIMEDIYHNFELATSSNWHETTASFEENGSVKNLLDEVMKLFYSIGSNDSNIEEKIEKFLDLVSPDRKKTITMTKKHNRTIKRLNKKI